MGARALALRSGRYPGAGGIFDFEGLTIDKTVQGNPWVDGSQQAGSNTAIESFRRWKLVDIAVFVVRNISAITYLP